MTEQAFERFNRASYNRLLGVLEDTESGTLTEENLLSRADAIGKEHPRDEYDNDRAWLDAVALAIMDALDKHIIAERKISPISDEMAAGAFADKEQASDERIDAKIARDLKQLGQIKTMKAIGLNRPRGVVTTEPLKQIESSPIRKVEMEYGANQGL